MAKKKKDVTATENTEAQSNQDRPAPKHSDYSYVVQNKKARALTKHRKAITIVGIILLILLLLAGVMYGFYAAVQINNFKIYIESSGGRILSLSPHSSMVPGSEMIEIIGPDEMTNTTFASGKNILHSTPIEDRLIEIISGEGSITNVDDYFIAGTFYMQNITSESKTYGERVSFDRATLGSQKALRVMLIRNDEIFVYAAPQTDRDGNYIKKDLDGHRIFSDEEGFYYLENEEKIRVENDGELQKEEVVPLSSGYTERKIKVDDNGEYYIEKSEGTDPWLAEFFYDEDYAVRNDGLTIAAGEKIKYSIIIWFEGWDSDCVDDIVNGEVQLSLSFACD